MPPRFTPQHGLRAFNALWDVIDVYAGSHIRLLVIPDPHKDLTTATNTRIERGALGYSQARIDVSLPDGDDRVSLGAHGRTIEEAARTLLAHHPTANPPLRAALKHAAERAGIHA